MSKGMTESAGRATKTIKIPRVKHPTLCFKTPPLDSIDPNPMVHCTKPKRHTGKHSWEK
jgi:hypothetical protein